MTQNRKVDLGELVNIPGKSGLKRHRSVPTLTLDHFSAAFEKRSKKDWRPLRIAASGLSTPNFKNLVAWVKKIPKLKALDGWECSSKENEGPGTTSEPPAEGEPGTAGANQYNGIILLESESGSKCPVYTVQPDILITEADKRSQGLTKKVLHALSNNHTYIVKYEWVSIAQAALSKSNSLPAPQLYENEKYPTVTERIKAHPRLPKVRILITGKPGPKDLERGACIDILSNMGACVHNIEEKRHIEELYGVDAFFELSEPCGMTPTVNGIKDKPLDGSELCTNNILCKLEGREAHKEHGPRGIDLEWLKKMLAPVKSESDMCDDWFQP